MSIKIIVHGDFKAKEVAEAICNVKPIGISCIGSKAKKIKDTMGYKHKVRFEVV